jgi:hypothetical protein
MPKATKPAIKKQVQRKEEKSSQHDRAPYQEDLDRDPVKSAEQTRHIPTKHGAIK